MTLAIFGAICFGIGTVLGVTLGAGERNRLRDEVQSGMEIAVAQQREIEAMKKDVAVALAEHEFIKFVGSFPMPTGKRREMH